MSASEDRIGAWIAITDDMRRRVRELGPRALERLHAFGLDDRREAAFALALAGAAPLTGLLLLDWDPISALLALFLNLLTILAEDIGKILRSNGRRAEMQREATEDDYVWRVARELADRRGFVHEKNLPGEAQVDAEDGGNRYAVWYMVPLILGVVGFALLLLLGDGSIYAHRAQFVYGTAPSLALLFATAAFHHWNRHPHWRRAGSVRLQTAEQTSMMVFVMGLTLMGALSARNRNVPEASMLALVLCTAPIGYGLWRAWRLLRLRATARWLKADLERAQPLVEARDRLVQRRLGARRLNTGVPTR